MTKENTKRTYDFCFSRWTRAPYAIFSSLHKIVKIGVVSVSCSFLSLCSQPLFAQTTGGGDTLREREMVLEEVIISNTSSIFVAPQQILAVISRKEIEQAGVETLQDLLLYVQGVDLRTRGNNGIQADISLHGGTFDQTIVLLNGINLTDPQTGHLSLNIPLHVEAIERIEVLEGPGSLAYNTVAFAGCVNIISRTPEENIVEASLTGGSYGLFRAAVNSHIRMKRFYVTLGGDLNRSEGFTDNTDYSYANLFVRMLYKDTKRGNVDIAGGYQDKSFGANSFYSATYKEQYEHSRTFFTSGSYNLMRNRWKIGMNASIRKLYDRFELFRNEAPAWYAGHNYHQTTVWGSNLQAAYNYRWGNTAIGVDYREEDLLSNNLGEALAVPIAVAWEDDSVFYNKTKTRRHVGFQLQQNYQRENFKTSLGVRGTWSNDYGFHGNIGLNGLLYLPKHVELNYFVQNVYRMPTFTDLYYSSASQTGNSHLQPEQAIVAEVGMTWNPGQWKLGITTFYRYGFRIIDWVRLSLTEKWFSQNMTHLQAVGTDVSVLYSPKKGYFSQMGVQYSYLHVSKNSQGYLSLYATDYLRHQIKVHIHHKIYWKLYAGWQFNWQSRAGSYLDSKTNTEQSYKPYLLCNLKLSLRLEKAQVYLEATNLFNIKYMDLGNIPQPGIWIKGGISLNIL
jgi:iron complex outermembrane receptor protein